MFVNSFYFKISRAFSGWTTLWKEQQGQNIFQSSSLDDEHGGVNKIHPISSRPIYIVHACRTPHYHLR